MLFDLLGLGFGSGEPGQHVVRRISRRNRACRRNPRHITCFDDLTAALRAWAKGLLTCQAAVELIAVRSARNDVPPGLSGWHGTIPFFVSLRRHARRDLPAPQRFLDEVGRHIADEVPQGWVHGNLRHGNAVVLIDGVDELPESRRDDVRRRLRDLIAAFPRLGSS